MMKKFLIATTLVLGVATAAVTYHVLNEPDLVIDLQLLAQKQIKSTADVIISDHTIDFKGVTRSNYEVEFKGVGVRNLVLKNIHGSGPKDPVVIIFNGVKIFSKNSSPLIKFDGNNWYVKVIGARSDLEPWSSFYGNTTGTVSQLIDITGNFNKGFEIAYFNLDQKRGKNSTDGGACVQWHGVYSSTCNASNWDGEYFIVHHLNITGAQDEGIYANDFEAAKKSTGFYPTRTRVGKFFDIKIKRSGRDGIQPTSFDSLWIYNNTIDSAGLESNTAHRAGISYNDGNKWADVHHNTVTNTSMLLSAQNHETTGKLKFHDNYFDQGKFVGVTPQQAVYLNVETAPYKYRVYDNVIKISRVQYAPFGFQADKGSDEYLTILDNNLFGPWPLATELRVIGTAGVKWQIDNSVSK